MVVVLPAPFGPMSPTSPPGGTRSDTSSTATTPPKRTDEVDGRAGSGRHGGSGGHGGGSAAGYGRRSVVAQPCDQAGQRPDGGDAGRSRSSRRLRAIGGRSSSPSSGSPCARTSARAVPTARAPPSARTSHGMGSPPRSTTTSGQGRDGVSIAQRVVGRPVDGGRCAPSGPMRPTRWVARPTDCGGIAQVGRMAHR